MEQKVDEILLHVSHSQQQLARLLETERHVAVRMAQIIHQLPDEDPEFGGLDGLMDSSSEVNKSVIAYLNGLADLQESMAELLERVMKELNGRDEE
ncbi:nucleoside-diphosphate sugar epimerase [Paenibacillus sp. P96]|uniref:Nucleoside-diphosphate sugar epimerase n=1 Tax=Paenibacillus zeirhizosphaerae TaxID=2987519 RepID=A0ABT9FUS0_9BACL|nr:nucleoside-diphosphate sugar epimerase [Paenibacillus sp. P96]MDP4098483.1 nucleoside-diphosphate sugar epimerase [Paenibacillus sp. P96]